MSPKSFDLGADDPMDDSPATTPAATPSRLSGRRVRIVAASGVALALATGGVAFAASGHDDGPNPGNGGARPTGTPPSGAPSGEAFHGGPGGRGPGGPGGGPGFGAGVGGPGFLHAVVVRSVSGGTETDDVQSGSVTAISSTSVTVKSSDGFTATYVIDSSTKYRSGRDSTKAPAVGAAVTVTAKVSGDTATATEIDTRPAAPNAPASASASPSAS